MKPIRLVYVAMLAVALVMTSHAAALAATLWRGTLVVTARTATTACMLEYDLGESFVVDYRPNLGTTANETIMVFGPFGAYLLSSVSSDLDKTLRTGGVSISGAAYAQGYARTNVSQPLTILPATIIASTPTITIIGTVANFGLAGCNVSFRASLLPVQSPF